MGSLYTPVRALSRGIAVLRALGEVGHASASDLARATSVDRTTTYRLLATLRTEGFVVYNSETKSYALTIAVRQLGDGFTDQDMTRQAVAAEMGPLTSIVKWPSDFATFHLGAMVIQESTHNRSPNSIHRAMIGRKRPLMRSALGRAMLAASPEDERMQMVQLAVSTKQPDRLEAGSQSYIARLRADMDRRGYASSIDGSEKGISAIALPIRNAARILGALNIIFFTRALSPEQAAERYLENLNSTVMRIEAKIKNLDRHQ